MYGSSNWMYNGLENGYLEILLVMVNKKFIEVSFNHISSLEYSKIRPRERLVASIFCLSLTAITLYLS